MCYRALGLMSSNPRFEQGQPCQGVLVRAHFPPASVDPHYHSGLEATREGEGMEMGQSRGRGENPASLSSSLCGPHQLQIVEWK